MHKITHLLILCFFLVPDTAFSQLVKVNAEDAAMADSYKEMYPEENYIAISSSEKYTFKYDTKTKKVQGNLKEEESIISLKELSKAFSKTIFYDEQSEVLRIFAYNYKNKSVPVYPSHSTYKSNGIFYADQKIATFSLSFSRIGDKRRYVYQKKIKDVKYLTKAYFHTWYPSQQKTIEFTIPKWLDVELQEVNFENFDIVKNETTNKAGDRVISYSLGSIAPIKNKKLSSGYAVSLPHILVVSKKYTYKGETHNLFNSTDDLYAWYSSLVNDVDNKPEEFTDQVNKLTSSANSDEEKIENIYYWVQDNIRYIAYEDGIMGFKPATAQDVYNKKYGDCKGMANLTCEMLKIAGFDARLTWVGTRAIPYSYSTPSLAVDNHMITALYFDNEVYFLDATEKGVAFKSYAHRIQGQDVLIANGESFTIDTIPEFDYKYNTQNTSLTLTLIDDSLTGTGEENMNGEEKNYFFRGIINTPILDREDEIIANLNSGDKNISISNLKNSDLEDRNKAVKLNYDITVYNQTTALDNELYINAEFDKGFAHLDIEEKRVNDLDFGRKINFERDITIKLPSGYRVDYMPEAIKDKNEDYTFFLEYKYNKEENKLVYTKKIIINEGIVKAKNILSWNKTIKEINKFYNDQIILIK